MVRRFSRRTRPEVVLRKLAEDFDDIDRRSLVYSSLYISVVLRVFLVHTRPLLHAYLNMYHVNIIEDDSMVDYSYEFDFRVDTIEDLV